MNGCPHSHSAVVASAVVFWLVRLGKTDMVEAGLSLPGGIAVACVALRTRSIWPAVIAHCTMNVIPDRIAMMSRSLTGNPVLLQSESEKSAG